jgi:photosystem II oxygen-evolving enhancer protein 2
LAALALGSTAANAAEEPSRMGGILEPYVDAPRGFKLLKPSGWNKFDVDPGVYDVKFQDLIEPFETVQVSTSPVATATSVDALGEVAAVGEKFAKGREAEVVKSKKRNVGDVLVYEFELKGPVYHELLLLSINKGKLYRLSCISRNPRWDKRKELYKNIALSFVPQGF